jgi:hypothetical protein
LPGTGPALFIFDRTETFGVLNRIIDSFRREPQIAVVVFVGIIIAFLSLSPTVMLFYGSFLSQPLGVPGAFPLNN